MYISGSKANSQRMLTKINETGVIAKLTIWVESDSGNISVKTFRIISSEMKISLLILSWSC